VRVFLENYDQLDEKQFIMRKGEDKEDKYMEYNYK
jgi:hypothetical protein